MNLQAEKLNVLQQIINANDLGLIRDVNALLKSRELDWFDKLNKTQKKDVEKGLSQLDKGISPSHEEIKMKFGI